MSDKSYVSMGLCPICHKENGTILMDRRLKDTFEMHTLTAEPCDACKKKYLTKGVMVLNPETGDVVVLKLSAFKRIFTCPVPPKHIIFAHDDVMQRLMPKKDEK